ncbi:MAG TPA: TetR/AcrR family transcriptional regulator [Candidatus Hydrogenedentes bacterium]|jgi:AcrR family transcriptional regulator|nr:TetR/AcrR family transcriptional regulator [Candidatus Hydrogenedentota bacterium]HOD95046.1 TetR/AcrR family transcriptional regulator [Candidatus Hydrogenedentota bacterium]HOH42679.1 TetR/AcrR family transcriptional regulator [Candidatus Hydrogenedentota bacterium]HOM49415.1 TetR/AcrR family transcriptional regulator [Candidatus Hydrogenedentota bacterium]HOR50354.1 TetR/AcrR family transcriptional regulator [Candidatus Hydrogenedentota bacterium]
MRAKKTNTEIRKEQILLAALKIIGSQGVNALSIVGVAEKVGIVPSALYRHFSSKEEILDGILDLMREKVLKNVQQARLKKHNALARLEFIMMRHLALLKESRALPLILLSDAMYLGTSARLSKIQEILESYLSALSAILKEGMEEGSIRADIVPESTAIMFLGMILPAAVLVNVQAPFFNLESHAANVWPAFVRSIAVIN